MLKERLRKESYVFFGRLVKSSSYLAYRKLLMMRILRWKYKPKEVTGFIPAVMKIAWKHGLWNYIEEFLEHGTFPSKCLWKRSIITAIHASEERFWREKLMSKEMESYLRIHSQFKALMLVCPAPTISIIEQDYYNSGKGFV